MPPAFHPARIRAVLFDFDGTLAEATLDFALMRKRAREAMALFGPLPEVPRVPVMEELARLCASLPRRRAEEAKCRTMEAIAEVEREAASRAALFPFTRSMLTALGERGVASAVVTRNCPDAVFTVFPDLAEHVACVLTRDDVKRVKPDPEHGSKALDIIGCRADEAVMVGDHPMDVETGKRLGTYTGAVASGEGGREALEAAGPDWLEADAGLLMRRLGLVEARFCRAQK